MEETKRLAAKLGILRKRSSASQRKGLAQLSAQEFVYVIVIDFESTCWRDVKNRSQEIIEFPAVLINLRNGEIESEFHHYVQPQESPVLSDFCKELTGISQAQVEDGIPISICLSKFRHWLQSLIKEKNIVFNRREPNQPQDQPLCTFVTWSDWDLAVCLQYECRRKQLRIPTELSAWIDLRATYRKFYSRRPQGLNGALQDLGIVFEGREHSGLDDAKNTAKLAWRMTRDGCTLKITKSLIKNAYCPEQLAHQTGKCTNCSMGQFYSSGFDSCPSFVGFKADASSDKQSPGSTVVTRPGSSSNADTTPNQSKPTVSNAVPQSRPTSAAGMPVQARTFSTGRRFDAPKSNKMAQADSNFVIYTDKSAPLVNWDKGQQPDFNVGSKLDECLDVSLELEPSENSSMSTSQGGGLCALNTAKPVVSRQKFTAIKQKIHIMKGLRDITNCNEVSTSSKLAPVKIIKKIQRRIQNNLDKFAKPSASNKSTEADNKYLVDTVVYPEAIDPDIKAYKTSLSYPNGKVFKPPQKRVSTSPAKTNIPAAKLSRPDNTMPVVNDHNLKAHEFKTPLPVRKSMNTNDTDNASPTSNSGSFIKTKPLVNLCNEGHNPNDYFQSPVLAPGKLLVNTSSSCKAFNKSAINNMNPICDEGPKSGTLSNFQESPRLCNNGKSNIGVDVVDVNAKSSHAVSCIQETMINVKNQYTFHNKNKTGRKSMSSTGGHASIANYLVNKDESNISSKDFSNPSFSSTVTPVTKNGITLTTPNSHYGSAHNSMNSISSNHSKGSIISIKQFYTPNNNSISSKQVLNSGTLNSKRSSLGIQRRGSCGMSAKRTPPLCGCGRRAVRKCVQTPGPNQGRFFFACPCGRSRSSFAVGCDETKKKQGCTFFKWE